MPRREPLSLPPPRRALLAATAAGMLAGCGGAPPLAVAPPTPGATAAAACGRLRAALPDKVDEGKLRPTTPKSDLTAAWRDPPVVMRCGVPAPTGIGPTTQLRSIDDVDWFTAGFEVTGPHVYTTVGRVATVELTVPDGRVPAGALVDLADPIKKALPTTK